MILKTQPNMKSLAFTDDSKPIWYLEMKDCKFSSITSSTLPLIIISSLSFLECITRLEEINSQTIITRSFAFFKNKIKKDVK